MTNSSCSCNSTTTTLDKESSDSFILKWVKATTRSSASNSVNTIPDLRNILNNTWRGKEVIKFYAQFKRLNNPHQKDICRAITEYFISNQQKLLLRDMSFYAAKIVKLFPTEKSVNNF